ncbi:MAG: hypothetical protein AAF363_20145, partial [Bacteroidota bacterium]
MKLALLTSRISISFILLLSFNINAQPSNDDQANGIEVSHQANWCSASDAYSTIDASSDGTKASRWNSGVNPYSDVWFRFQATGTNVTIDLMIGDINFPMIALWDDSGNELASSGYMGNTQEVGLGSDQLIIGNWYYIQVDNRDRSDYRGTFGLCISTELTNDFQIAAQEIPHESNWCSATTYSTAKATPDGSKASRWNSGSYPFSDVWFRFQATATSVTVELNRGDINFPMIALWDDTGNELASSGFMGNQIDVGLGSNQLIVGNWYYIQIDNRDRIDYRGSFELCVSTDLTYDFKEAAHELTDLNNICTSNTEFSTAEATPDGFRASTWQFNPFADVWFTFTAQGTDATIDLLRGDIEFPMIALWDSNNNEIVSSGHLGMDADLSITTDQLIAGEEYYISVDSRDRIDRRGTFGLCIDNPSESNDFISGAIEVPHQSNWYSGEDAYTTVGMSADGPDPGCGSPATSPVSNVWFTFQATSENISINYEGGVRHRVVLWNSDLNPIVCERSRGSSIELGSVSLVPGSQYYISVDHYEASPTWQSPFQLSITDQPSYDFHQGAIEIPHQSNWYSGEDAYTTVGMSADGPDPSCGSPATSPVSNVWFTFEATSENISINYEGGVRHRVVL